MSALPHPLEQVEIKLTVKLKGDLAPSALEIAARRNQPPDEMLADVLTMAIKDDMVDAILDDGRETA